MTKQLAPIEELAKNITSLEVINGIVYFSTEVPIENGEYSSELVEVNALIKELRQAIIKDFVSKLEPVHSQFFDVNKWYDYLNEKHKKNTIEAGYLHRDLYDLSEWSNK